MPQISLDNIYRVDNAYRVRRFLCRRAGLPDAPAAAGAMRRRNGFESRENGCGAPSSQRRYVSIFGGLRGIYTAGEDYEGRFFSNSFAVCKRTPGEPHGRLQ